MSDAALEQAKKAIPADIRMYSGCRDEQTSAVSTPRNDGTYSEYVFHLSVLKTNALLQMTGCLGCG